MGFDKVKMRQIRGIILFVAVLLAIMLYSGSVLSGLVLLYGILQPFLVGAAIAFVLNLPLRAIEEKLLKKWKGKVAARIKRPICILLSILALLLVVALVTWIVVPQVTETVTELAVQIPIFFSDLLKELEKLSKSYPQIWEYIQELKYTKVDWEAILESAISFLKSGMGSMLTSTVSIASSLIGGIFNTFISFIFAIYILAQKEKLADQGKRILRAYCSEKWYEKVLKVLQLLNRNFSNFISGQCLEALILGTMFVIVMSIFGFPYAVLVGVLVACTALIPIVGAFVGCIVGAFLILINDPLQALWFIIMFLIIQQIEGNLIYPRVVGSSVGLPSIWVLLAVSVGGSLLGVLGMLIFIPIVSTFYALLRENVNLRNSEKIKEEVKNVAEDLKDSRNSEDL